MEKGNKQMIFLDSPCVTASKTEWKNWLEELKRMDQNNPSILFAIRRAENIIRLIDETENQSPT